MQIEYVTPKEAGPGVGTSTRYMRILACFGVALLGAATLGVGAAQAQAGPVSSPGTAPSTVQDAPAPELPVSLDHIRERLKQAPEKSLLRDVDLPADFRVEIQEQRKIDEMLSKLDFRSGPAPPGGLYGFEQQRRLFSPTSRPLMQPYAAFSGGQLITLAIEGLLQRYLGGRLIDEIRESARERAEEAARRVVRRDVAAYCASRPDRYQMVLCNPDAR